jgi:hypothetical protein
MGQGTSEGKVTRKETLVRLIDATGMLWFAQGAVNPIAPISHRFYMTYSKGNFRDREKVLLRGN